MGPPCPPSPLGSAPAVRERLSVVVNFNILFHACSFCAPSMTSGFFLEHNQETPSSWSRDGCVCLGSSVDRTGWTITWAYVLMKTNTWIVKALWTTWSIEGGKGKSLKTINLLLTVAPVVYICSEAWFSSTHPNFHLCFSPITLMVWWILKELCNGQLVLYHY